jgi:hypothetical protein
MTESRANEKYDRFFTKKEIAKQCIDLLNLTQYKTIIEPSAGGGAFSSQISGIQAYDIRPESDSIQRQDFLRFNSNKVESPCLVLGNPPWGRQNSLAVSFMNKAAEFSNTIAFILPKTFKKQSQIDRVNRWFHLTESIDLPTNSFTHGGQDYDVPCCFQIWERKNYMRSLSSEIQPNEYKYVQKVDSPDFCIRRVGGRSGYVTTKTDVSPQSHYFVKLDKPENVDAIVDAMNNIEWSHDNTVGPKSISRREITLEFNQIIDLGNPENWLHKYTSESEKNSEQYCGK